MRANSLCNFEPTFSIARLVKQSSFKQLTRSSGAPWSFIFNTRIVTRRLVSARLSNAVKCEMFPPIVLAWIKQGVTSVIGSMPVKLLHLCKICKNCARQRLSSVSCPMLPGTNMLDVEGGERRSNVGRQYSQRLSARCRTRSGSGVHQAPVVVAASLRLGPEDREFAECACKTRSSGVNHLPVHLSANRCFEPGLRI
jgi:hypothetical protein